ncbi:MAG: carbon storage regulator [Pirellulales bacterium]
MLVLTRKTQQQIKVGDDIVITILKVRGKQVQVGIEAPRNVRVLRGEVPADEPPREMPANEPSREMPVERPALSRTPGRRFGRAPAARACTLA